MIIELPPPPLKIVWGQVLWVVSALASILWASYVPGEGIDGARLAPYAVCCVFVLPPGLLAYPLLAVALPIALYDKVMFWFSLRRRARPDHSASFSGGVSVVQAPRPADVPPPLRGFQAGPMPSIQQPIEI
jgi:hypothetical protein